MMNIALARKTRELLGLTLDEVAGRMKGHGADRRVSPTSVMNWENGISMPRFNNGCAWARALGLTPDDLAGPDPAKRKKR